MAWSETPKTGFVATRPIYEKHESYEFILARIMPEFFLLVDLQDFFSDLGSEMTS